MHFEKNLKDWINNRFFEQIPFVEGGWEYWIQIDFVAWIDKKSGQQFDFRREVMLPGIRVDWFVNSNSKDIEINPTAIEIKAQTPKYLKDRFIADVQKDIEKLKMLPDKYSKIMLAAVIDKSTAEALSELSEIIFRQVAFYQDNMAIYKAEVA